MSMTWLRRKLTTEFASKAGILTNGASMQAVNKFLLKRKAEKHKVFLLNARIRIRSMQTVYHRWQFANDHH